MTTVAAPARFDIGRVISRLLGVLGRNLATFLALAVLLVGLPTALVAFAQARFAFIPDGPTVAFGPAWISLGFAAWLVSLVANAVLQGAIIHGTVSDLGGRRASFGDCLGTGVRFILPLVGIGLVIGVSVAFEIMLLIVPGVLLALAWSVASPAAVMERTGVFGALDRSRALTRNHRGAILGLSVIYFVILLVVQGVVSTAVVGLGLSLAAGVGRNAQAAMIPPMLVTLLVQTLTAMISAAGVASIYYELRLIKDGVGAEQLASVFE